MKQKGHKSEFYCRTLSIVLAILVFVGVLPTSFFVIAASNVVRYTLDNPEYFGYAAGGKSCSYASSILTWAIEGAGIVGTPTTYKLSFYNKTDYISLAFIIKQII